MKFEEKQKISAPDLLRLIPDEQLSRLAGETKVDCCTKVLYGRSVFYLLLYALLQTERTGQRTLEDIFKIQIATICFFQRIIMCVIK